MKKHNDKITWTEFRDALASLFLLSAILGIVMAAPAYVDAITATRDEIQRCGQHE